MRFENSVWNQLAQSRGNCVEQAQIYCWLLLCRRLTRTHQAMSSRRGGRGRGGRSNLEAIGIPPGESVPPPILQPPPLYPPMERRPLELSDSESDQYLVRVKEEFQLFMHQSPFNLKFDSVKSDIERYSDKYKASFEENDLQRLVMCIPSWSLFPRELHLRCRKRPRSSSGYSPVVSRSRKRQASSASPVNLKQLEGDTEKDGVTENKLTKLAELEEETVNNPEEGDEEEVIEDEVYDEEIEEEEGDYQLSYFDPGEDFVADEDDALEDGHF